MFLLIPCSASKERLFTLPEGLTHCCGIGLASSTITTLHNVFIFLFVIGTSPHWQICHTFLLCAGCKRCVGKQKCPELHVWPENSEITWLVFTFWTVMGWFKSRPPCKRNPHGTSALGRWSQIVSIAILSHYPSFVWIQFWFQVVNILSSSLFPSQLAFTVKKHVKSFWLPVSCAIRNKLDLRKEWMLSVPTMFVIS